MLNIQKMMKQAQEMQSRMQEVQEKLKDIDIEAEAGGGLVKVVMSCAGIVKSVLIDDSLIGSDKETLEDLIVAAMNNANDTKDEKIKQETMSMMEAMGLPAGGAGLPF